MKKYKIVLTIISSHLYSFLKSNKSMHQLLCVETSGAMSASFLLEDELVRRNCVIAWTQG